MLVYIRRVTFLGMQNQAYHPQGITISYDQAKAEHILIIDVRAEREYVAGHIPDAISLPLTKILQVAGDDYKLSKTFGSFGIGHDTQCVFYDDAFGAVASRVAMALESVGGRASLLDVTYTIWRRDHTPNMGEPRRLDPITFLMADRSSLDTMLTDIKDVKAVTESNDSSNDILLDARERLNFLSGHIPGAINMPYTMFKDAENDKILRTPDDLSRIFKNRGLDPNRPIRIITYCGSSGTLSGLVYYALRQAGFASISMYANSFREWNSQEGRAVEVQEDANYWDLSAE
ncbi:MAG: sulfurtransferase [Cenarchaeum sp. SB0663_bin_5]|nr:sulfurtransferase [Cenarchaeum sp. SB0663_bin_5]MYH04690.1 sulfurtransferase [Cenarchaeum sp. SB0675_bin_21]MYL11611.1 sulfurtransferase [Cenarchaeum sp. SB0669_bin_11]